MHPWKAPRLLRVTLAALAAVGCGDATGPEPPAAGEIVFTAIRGQYMRIWVANADGTDSGR